jgi:hypothetical protein
LHAQLSRRLSRIRFQVLSRSIAPMNGLGHLGMVLAALRSGVWKNPAKKRLFDANRINVF